MSNKRYYWLKLNENFFDDETTIWIEEGENGKDHVIFYLKLLLKSVSENGVLVRYVGEQLIPYDVNALARLTNTKPDTVKVAMDRFNKVGLISILEHGEIYMNQVKEMIGTETASAVRKRRSRAKAKREEEQLKLERAGQCHDNVQVSHSNVQKGHTDIDIELEKELETEKEIELQQEEKKEKNDVVVDNLQSDMKKVIQFHQNNIGVVSPYAMEDLEGWVKDVGVDLVMEALKRTVENQKTYSYTKGILRNWVRNSIKTIEEVEAQDVAFNNKNNKRFNQSKSRKKESLPDWATQESPNDDVIASRSADDSNLKDRLERLREMKSEE